MLIDARELPDGTTLQADVAVAGGGPAGISLGRALERRGVTVCIVEAGGLEPDAAVQALYEGETTGIDYPLAATRLRYLGGSSNHWGGYTRPLDPIDFEARDWVPYSGWPFGIAALNPYYPAASRLVEVAPGHFDDVAYWQAASGEKLLKFATGRMRHQFVHFSPPTRFGERYRRNLENAHGIQVLLNANVVNIGALESGRAVSRLDVRTLTGLHHTVKARVYVVATGGLENARLLLLSNLGNQNDLVGRFFMEHPHLGGFCEIVIADINRLPLIYRERVTAGGSKVKVAFNPTQDFMRERRLLNATFMTGVAGNYPRSGPAQDEDPMAVQHRDMLMAAGRFLADGTGEANAADSGQLGVWMGVGCACEQVPNPDSRVGLSTERDALGLNRISLDWRLTEQGRRSIVEHMHSLALEFGALGIGRTRVNVADDGRWPAHVNGGSHHMGTTRMHDDPKLGVVDHNCRVHGLDNLYVAGSSVFPTSGAANPTLTLLALTLRLADHLGVRLR
ncbi:MAG: GMC family oxidoreductase [Gammaproteobacteria bacterium]|jgi:choline dehydrogenase-like flavoprotein